MNARFVNKRIFIKEAIGLPTYICGAILANLSSTNLVGFVAAALVMLYLYNVTYLYFFPGMEYQGRAYALVTFFFAQLALWGSIWLVWGN